MQLYRLVYMYGGWVMRRERRHQGKRNLSDVIFGWEGSSADSGSRGLKLEWI